MNNLLKEELPYYKMLNNPTSSIHDIELIASILGGTSQALDNARQIYNKCQHNLIEVARLKKADLLQYKGVGKVTAAAFIASMEFFRRAKAVDGLAERSTIRSSQDAYNFLSSKMMALDHEEAWVLILSRANQVLGIEKIGEGGLTATVVCKRKLFTRVIRSYPRAAAIILSHNHPSGNLNPSEGDKAITKQIKDAGAILDIKLLDHIIVAGAKYLSFGDEGIL